jgi:hypothetical protein
MGCVEASCSHKLHTLHPAYRRDYVEGQTLDSKWLMTEYNMWLMWFAILCYVN